jgi:hypothetical protein
MKLPLLLASLAALAVGYGVRAVLRRKPDERTLTEWKRAAFSDGPADAEQRLRQRYDGMVTR